MSGSTTAATWRRFVVRPQSVLPSQPQVLR
jgi:hypothetical protein